MAQGKDPRTADGLGGVHNVHEPRPTAVPALPDTRETSEPVVVAEGQRAGYSRTVDDPDQVGKVIHTVEAPVELPDDANAREFTLQPTRTPDAPHQDVQVSPAEPSVWTAAKDPAGD